MQSTVFVYTLNGGKGKWSRYGFSFSVDAFAQLADDLYMRQSTDHGDAIVVVDPDLTTDAVLGAGAVVTPTPFDGLVQWGWLDLGQPGVTKMLEGFDVVGSGTPAVSIGYDQRSTTAFTEPYTIDADTVPGDIIPLPVVAPSMSLRLTYAGGEAWSLQAATLYLTDQRATT